MGVCVWRGVDVSICVYSSNLSFNNRLDLFSFLKNIYYANICTIVQRVDIKYVNRNNNYFPDISG